ncbi:MAG: hypothetical protein QXX08_10480 [Candidatus Bathyarchaeia archaeon]
MSLNSDIEDIRSKLKVGSYQNEAAVSQGIILRLLNALGWPIFDPSRVSPEYTVGGGRVDYALCHPPGKPIILIESKNVGSAYGSEKQLFEYAFHQGIPMAVLTDGQEWSFFLPGEQGAYHERCVYKLDLIARSTEECCRVFDRYLNYAQVISGEAIKNAKNDYRDVSRQRQIETALPQAWQELIKEQDETLVELIADKVETLCGFKPDPDTVRKFLNSLQEFTPQKVPIVDKPPKVNSSQKSEDTNDFSGFILYGQSYPEGSAIRTMIRIFELLHQKDSSFLERYARLPKHGRKRRYLARNKMDLYPGRPDLCEQYSEQIAGGWWVGTNYSRSTIRHAIELACEVAGIRFGSDLKLI